MAHEANIENGFAKVGDGVWLVGDQQPTAFLGECTPRSLRGFIVPDRSRLHLMEVRGSAWCGRADRPFLTQIPCAAPIRVLSSKLLVAPADARTEGRLMRVIPFSFRNALCVTECTSEWLVTATRSRTVRLSLEEDELLSVRLEAAVAWTTKPPTAFLPRLTWRDILVPRPRARNLMLHFYGPGIVWMEGSNAT